jgi:hypothetical protein
MWWWRSREPMMRRDTRRRRPQRRRGRGSTRVRVRLLSPSLLLDRRKVTRRRRTMFISLLLLTTLIRLVRSRCRHSSPCSHSPRNGRMSAVDHLPCQPTAGTRKVYVDNDKWNETLNAGQTHLGSNMINRINILDSDHSPKQQEYGSFTPSTACNGDGRSIMVVPLCP